MAQQLSDPIDAALASAGIPASRRAIDLLAAAHDASHYRRVPALLATPRDAEDVAALFGIASRHSTPVTFRSGGTSLSGQGVTGALLADTRSSFRSIRVADDGLSVVAGPGATVRQVNARLARHHRKLGPDPASEIACTIGGVVANNSSGMACGITDNTYRTLTSMRLVLPSGTIIDTADAGAEERLRTLEPALHAGLLELRERLLGSPDDVATVRRLFAMKNTMGYGVNALLDYERAVDILTHLVIGSEGTLAFVAEARFATVGVLPAIATGLLVFDTLRAATAALPALVAEGFATIELLDARSLRVARSAPDVPAELAAIGVDDHAALLVEVHAHDEAELEASVRRASALFSTLPLAVPVELTTDAARRAALWHTRKGLYAAVAGARPSGTTALLEDVVVPVERLLTTCERLQQLFDEHGYEESVIFGHAKDGNIHFMLNERFDDPARLERYRAFTDHLVELILSEGGSLKAEHGTGRVMAPFVRRQYGDRLYRLMREIKSLCDPRGILNPGVVLSDDPDSYLADMKLTPTVEAEVDRCVECGYCEPFCPSKDLTLTPRQRIVLRRELAVAERAGDTGLAAELRSSYEYEGVQTCAVDGMCATACPVGINTGDLVRRLRAEGTAPAPARAWAGAAHGWGAASRLGALALSTAKHTPGPLITTATRAARAVLGAENVPLYDGSLPGGGRARSRLASEASVASQPATADAVFFAACIGAMFGPADGSMGATRAFLTIAARAGLTVVVPDGVDAMCCGTPWKSKGYVDGHRAMAERVLPALLVASGNGRLPIVCDAASCTEGLETLRDSAAGDERYRALRFVDATQFVADHALDRLTVTAQKARVMVHPTCSTTALGANAALEAIAARIGNDVRVPDAWGCCAFAGDRGLLHPELTASATAAEAREVAAVPADEYVSANRTCEIGMTRATGRTYRHVLEALEEATR